MTSTFRSRVILSRADGEGSHDR